MQENSESCKNTPLIDNARLGDPSAENQLCDIVFNELYDIAKRIKPKNDNSMLPTMLVSDLRVKRFPTTLWKGLRTEDTSSLSRQARSEKCSSIITGTGNAKGGR